jgi:hypothetical protein
MMASTIAADWFGLLTIYINNFCCDSFPFANINRVQLLLHLSINLLVLVGLSDSYIPLNLKYNL